MGWERAKYFFCNRAFVIIVVGMPVSIKFSMVAVVRVAGPAILAAFVVKYWSLRA